jgi:hypothetical protein
MHQDDAPQAASNKLRSSVILLYSIVIALQKFIFKTGKS